ncbi:MAG: prepilin-type N-terminal cleavage/methylation domain-containing protein [Candidatus Kaiserbacteria bacterium]|nr:prepilin-type N-terminal cleavage/methylation domain-containing protein [Candidatus Kaiserbacteria bacterium]
MHATLKNKRGRVKGFTLIELLIVIAIIGALAAIIVVSLTGSTESARKGVAQVNLGQVERMVIILTSVQRIDVKNVCTITSSAEHQNLKKIIDSSIGGGNMFTITGNRMYVRHDRDQARNSGNKRKTLDFSEAGCISNDKSSETWVVWFTPEGGEETYCIDSTSGGEMEKITLSTSKYLQGTAFNSGANCSALK